MAIRDKAPEDMLFIASATPPPPAVTSSVLRRCSCARPGMSSAIALGNCQEHASGPQRPNSVGKVPSAPCIFQSTKPCSTISIYTARDGNQGHESRSRWRKARLGGTSSQSLSSASEETEGQGFARYARRSIHSLTTGLAQAACPSKEHEWRPRVSPR